MACVSNLEDAYIVDWITCVSDLEDAYIVDWIACVSDLEDAYIVERLFASSLVAIVNQQHPRKLKVCHFKKGTEICNYSYSGSILNCKLNRQVADQWKKLSWLSLALLLCLFGGLLSFYCGVMVCGVFFLDCWVLPVLRQVLILFIGLPEDVPVLFWVLCSFSWLVQVVKFNPFHWLSSSCTRFAFRYQYHCISITVTESAPVVFLFSCLCEIWYLSFPLASQSHYIYSLALIV